MTNKDVFDALTALHSDLKTLNTSGQPSGLRKRAKANSINASRYAAELRNNIAYADREHPELKQFFSSVGQLPRLVSNAEFGYALTEVERMVQSTKVHYLLGLPGDPPSQGGKDYGFAWPKIKKG